MGKKSWCSAMKKAVTPSFIKIKKGKRSNKSKSNPKTSCYENQMSVDTCSSPTEPALANSFQHYDPMDFEVPENEQIKHMDSVILAAPRAAADVNFTTSNSSFLGKTREEVGAIKIQTAYRGYKAKRAFKSLRAILRLNLWIQGQAAKHQTASTLIRMQTMSRVQSQVCARRIRVAQVNETVQRQRRKREKQAFDLSPRSKEQVDAMLKRNNEAVERRKKALAYAFSRQQAWRNSRNFAYAASHIDWRWSWSNRWDCIRPWETKTASNKESSVQRSKSTSPTSKRLNTGYVQVGLAKKVTTSPRKNSITLIRSR